MSLIFTKKLCAMTTKNDAKFEERFHCQFKLDMKNLANFYQALKSLKNLHFDWFLFFANHITFNLKKYRGVIFHDTAKSCKI